jgi:hypothetical protein
MEEVTYTMSMEDRDSTGECPKCQRTSRTGTECGDTSCTDILMTKSSSRKKASSRCLNWNVRDITVEPQGTKTCKTGKIEKTYET